MSIAKDFIELIFHLLMWLVFFRFWLQWAGANFFNPITEVVSKLSDPLCKPFRKILPHHPRYDWASLLTLLTLAILTWLVHFAFIGFDSEAARVDVILIRALFLMGHIMLQGLFMVLIIRAIASWIAPQGGNPALQIFIQLTEPLLAPIRRVIPPTSGIDFSPMILILLVWLAMRILQQI